MDSETKIIEIDGKPVTVHKDYELPKQGGARRGAGRQPLTNAEKALKKATKSFTSKNQKQIQRSLKKLIELTPKALERLEHIIVNGDDQEARQAAQAILKHTIPEVSRDSDDAKNTIVVYIPDKINREDWQTRANQVIEKRVLGANDGAV